MSTLLPRPALVRTAALALAAPLAVCSVALAAPISEDVAEGERLWVANDLDGSMAALDRAIAANPDDVEALWRKARNLYSMGELKAQGGATPAQRIQMYEEVLTLAKRIQAADPGHPQGHFWEGTALGRIATAKGVLSSLFSADDIEGAWLKASGMKGYSYRSSNGSAGFPADTYFALGQFYRLCPDWTVVKILTGTKGDIDKSIQWLRKGVADSPKRLEMKKELGVSLLCKWARDGDEAALAEGKQVLQSAAKMTPLKKPETIDVKQIPLILSKAEEACGYSRDGWQDVSRESYDKK